MARKSNNLDKKMIRVGMTLIKKKGVARLSVREVAEKAGANLGMFNYHFGSKEQFLRQALDEIYRDFIHRLESSRSLHNDLEVILIEIAMFSRDNCQLLTALFSDVLSQEKVVTRFLRENFSVHFQILDQALQQYLKQKGLRVKNPHHALRFLIGAVGIPNVLLEVANRWGRDKAPFDSDLQLKQRTRAAVIGLEMALCESSSTPNSEAND